MAKAIRRAQQIPPLRTIPHELATGTYEPTWQPLRPGADDALKIPSRVNNRLVYRDGRVETLA